MAPDLGLQYLPMSHKKDARLIYGVIYVKLKVLSLYLNVQNCNFYFTYSVFDIPKEFIMVYTVYFENDNPQGYK